jgi:His/Glu/Gln/Arg/opine family amino acid ABC transporter permease subunit
VTGASAPPATLSPIPSTAGPVSGFRRLYSWKAWAPVVYGIVGTVVGVLFLLELGYLKVYRLPFALAQVDPLLGGFYISLEVVATILPIGFGLGFLVGWARTTRYLVLRGLGSVYVDFFRSMPPIALIVFASLIGGIELKGSSLDPYQIHNLTLWLGVFALALHTAAYQAEIVRAGILSVPVGQTDAADAVGVSRLRSMFVVVLPQAFRVSLPALGNEFSSSIKDTSLLFTIGWVELSGVSFIQSSFAYSQYLYGSLVIWIEAAFLYFVLTYLVTRTVRGVEDLFKVPGLEVART